MLLVHTWVVEVNGYKIEPGAKLNNADLDSADLTGANLEDANLEDASRYLATMPDGTIYDP